MSFWESRKAQALIYSCSLISIPAGIFAMDGGDWASLYIVIATGFGTAIPILNNRKNKHVTRKKDTEIESLRERSEKTKAQLETVSNTLTKAMIMNDVLQSSISSVNEAIESNDSSKATKAESMIAAVLAVSIGVFDDAKKVRITRWELTKHRNKTTMKSVGPPYGRKDKTVTKFSNRTHYGKAMLEEFKYQDLISYPDLDTKWPAGFDKDRSRRYKSFVTARVDLDGEMYGMISVDSPEKEVFSDADKEHLLAITKLVELAVTVKHSGSASEALSA